MLRTLVRAGVLGAALASGVAWAQGAPATSPAGQPAAQGQDPNAKQSLDFVHTWAVRTTEWGKLASEKGTSPKVKEFGRKLVEENGKLDQQAKSIAQERGIQLTDAGALASNQKAEVDKARAMTGAQFDEAVMQGLLTDRENQVAELKRMRDQTTGKDAKLKKFLDDAENVMEQQRNDARVALKESKNEAQRQGRTPAK